MLQCMFLYFSRFYPQQKLATHELRKSGTCDKNQAVVFATHKLRKSGTHVRNQAVVFATYKHRNSRTHNNKKKGAALVFVVST